jgi:inorganic pyrophosphatase/exopolyphosphatase
MFTQKTDITARDIKRLLLKVYKQYKTGEIPEQKAYKESYILYSLLRAIETTEIENRLQQIERAIQDGK